MNSGVDTNTKVIAVTKTYRVLLLGRIEEKQDFEEKMEKLGFSPESVRELIAKAPSVLKVGQPLGEAREYAEAIQEAGGRVNIQEDGVSEEFNRLHPPIEIRSQAKNRSRSRKDRRKKTLHHRENRVSFCS